MVQTGENSEHNLQLTEKFARAIEYARVLHLGYRKATKVPYMAHLLGVASLVTGENGYLPFPVTEDMAIAALLHDAVEDAGGMPRLRDIEANFGPEVARMVEGCSDSFEEDSSKKEPWEIRKNAYIERLRTESDDTQLISAADKLYNARAILEDYKVCGAKVWERFKRGREDQLWYVNALLKVFEEKGSNRIVKQLKQTVADLTAISAREGQSSS